jgi:hypothetical protein
MSAFIVNPEHIAALVAYTQAPTNKMHCYNIHTKQEINNTAKNFCTVLAQANIKSVDAKYGDNTAHYSEEYIEHLMLFPNQCFKALQKFKGMMGFYGCPDLTNADIYNMACCLEYQCCEVDTWTHQDGYWLIQAIKGAAARKMASGAAVQWNYEAA